MPAAGSDLGNDKRVSVSICVVRASHTAGMLGLSVDVCLHSVLIFLSPYQSPDRRMPSHVKCTYSSLSPFLDEHRTSCVLKEDKSSYDTPSSSHPHPLWFYVVIMTTCKFWHCCLLWGHRKAVFFLLFFSLSVEYSTDCRVTTKVKQVLWTKARQIFSLNVTCVIGEFKSCIIKQTLTAIQPHHFVTIHSPSSSSSVLYRSLIDQTQSLLSFPYLSCWDLSVILFSWVGSHLFCLQGYWTLFPHLTCSFCAPNESICFLFTCILIDAPVMTVTSLSLLFLCRYVSRDFFLSVFSPALSLLSVIPSGRTALLIMQHIILLASLSGELLCRLGGRIWSQAKRSIHRIAAQQESLRERERAREMGKTWWRGQWGRDGQERNGLEDINRE